MKEEEAVLYLPVGLFVKALVSAYEPQDDIPVFSFVYHDIPIIFTLSFSVERWRPTPIDQSIFQTIGDILDSMVKELLLDRTNPVVLEGCFSDMDTTVDFRCTASENLGNTVIEPMKTTTRVLH